MLISGKRMEIRRNFRRGKDYHELLEYSLMLSLQSLKVGETTSWMNCGSHLLIPYYNGLGSSCFLLLFMVFGFTRRDQ
jgi:hypothetical protein